ncbi:MAG: type II CAAX endopeptidase family protein [Planctomycetota bacterium]|nr:type II CAAX endopeptidase family protein [Planctomycetota bacterium]MDA1212740.1 type II CAAX endopeptidase family protein [Planctomycetota bacterium]
MASYLEPIMQTLERSFFLNMAAIFEGGLLLVALFLGWLMGINPIEHLYADAGALGWGVLATVPMLVLFAISFRFPVGSLRTIKKILIDTLGPPLAACHWYDLFLLGILAGVTEEVLFRGFLQIWFEQGGLWTGLICANVIFGLAHFVTPMYALLAGQMGLYFSWIFAWQEPRNLLIPITAHAVYDFIAFWVVAAVYRRQSEHRESTIHEREPDDSSGTDDETSPPDVSSSDN